MNKTVKKYYKGRPKTEEEEKADKEIGQKVKNMQVAIGTFIGTMLIKGKTTKQVAQLLEVNWAIKDKIINQVKTIKELRPRAEQWLCQPFYYQLKFRWEEEDKLCTVLIDGADKGKTPETFKHVKECEEWVTKVIKPLVDEALRQVEQANNPFLKEMEELMGQIKTPPRVEEEEEKKQITEANEEEIEIPNTQL